MVEGTSQSQRSGFHPDRMQTDFDAREFQAHIAQESSDTAESTVINIEDQRRKKHERTLGEIRKKFVKDGLDEPFDDCDDLESVRDRLKEIADIFPKFVLDISVSARERQTVDELIDKMSVIRMGIKQGLQSKEAIAKEVSKIPAVFDLQHVVYEAVQKMIDQKDKNRIKHPGGGISAVHEIPEDDEDFAKVSPSEWTVEQNNAFRRQNNLPLLEPQVSTPGQPRRASVEAPPIVPHVEKTPEGYVQALEPEVTNTSKPSTSVLNKLAGLFRGKSGK